LNYKRIHDDIINRALTRKALDGYTEKHHVIPKAIGGCDTPENIVLLTAKEHFIIHLLLRRIFPNCKSFIHALWAMCGINKKGLRYKPSANVYAEAKLAMSESMKERLKKDNVWTGRKHTSESKKKQSESAKKRKITPEKEEKRRSGISVNNKKPKSEEHRDNIRLSKLGPKNPMFGTKWKIENGKRIYEQSPR
jgi:hypothetical protein